MLSRVYYRTDSVPPDNPCPIRFLWRSMNRGHVSDHVGGWALPGGNDVGGLAQQSSPQSAAVGVPPYRPTHGLRIGQTRVLEVQLLFQAPTVARLRVGLRPGRAQHSTPLLPSSPIRGLDLH